MQGAAIKSGAVLPRPAPPRDRLRRFDGSLSDYDAFAEILAASRPRHPRAVSELLADDWKRSLDDFCERWVVERDGRTIAVGTINDPSWSPRPGKYHIFMFVHPDVREHGVGTLLFDRLRASVEPRGLTALTAETSEDQPEAIRFLDKRGFELVLRAPMSRLDLSSVDRRLLETPNASSDIRVESVAELARRDPSWFDQLWQIVCDTARDIPADEPLATPSRDELQRWLHYPSVDPAALFVALDRSDRWLGVSGLHTRPADPTTLSTWFTGVRREHRRRGVATALKTAAVRWAIASGAQTLETENEENNPMLGINLRFGFRVAPAWLDYKWER